MNYFDFKLIIIVMIIIIIIENRIEIVKKVFIANFIVAATVIIITKIELAIKIKAIAIIKV